MPLSPSRQWTLFRAVRVLIYSLATIASMGIAAIYAVLVIRGWYSLNVEQRAIIIVLLVIYVISTVMLYSMLIFRFRLGLDGARLALLILAQVGGTVVFDIFYPSLPCVNLGTMSTCKLVETIAIFGGWSLSGLLLLFTVYLASMHYVPVPTRRPNPETMLALQLVSERERKWSKDEKRSSMKSMASASSVYSQQSHITPYPYMAPSELANSRRSPTPANGQYRSQSPAYVQSTGPQGDQYRSQAPPYMQPAASVNDQYRARSPVYMQSQGPRYTPRPDMERLAPPFDGTRTGTPVSMRSAEAAATLGPHNSRLAQAYDYNRSGTPGPGVHTARPAPTYDYSHSRSQSSTGSTQSGSSHGSHNARVPQFAYNNNRSLTPALSVRSVALTTASSIRTAPRQRYYQNNGITAPRPLLVPERNYSSLSQAFIEPISRQGTPMTSLSNTSFYMPARPPPMMAPPGLAPVGPGYNFPQPPGSTYAGPPSYPPSQPPTERGRARSPNPAPRPVQLRDDRNAPARADSAASDASTYSARSGEPVRARRSDTFSSVPRSPSPDHASFHSVPQTPLSAVLPARPDLSPAVYIGRYGSPAPDSQRQRPQYGAVPDISVNDAPVARGGSPLYQVGGGGGYQRETPDRTWAASPADDAVGSVSQWRQRLVYTPRPVEGGRI